MRRQNLLPTLLLLALAALAGCSQEHVVADSVDLAPTIAADPAEEDAELSVPIQSLTPTPAGWPAAPIGGTPAAQDSDPDMQDVAALLQREVPTLPAIGGNGEGRLPATTGDLYERSDSQAPDTEPLLLPTPTPQPAQSDPDPSAADAAESPVGVVNASVVNVRTGPGTVYPVVGQVRRSTDFRVTGRNADGSWLQICCPFEDDGQNWIAADFVDVRLSAGDALDDLSIAEAPPAPEPSANAASTGSAPAPQAAPAAAGLPGPGAFSAPGGTNPLTGRPLPGGRSGQRPIIVCLNNDFAARPQFGTSQADVMYEYLMEGYGITRFSAIYYGGTSGQIGPVRSARLINYYMGALYDAGLVCSGASDAVRYALKHQAPFPYLDIDLDDPSNTRYSVSIGSDYRTRLRTATDSLRKWLADWGVEKPAAIRGFTFGGVPGGGATATSISIPYPNGQVSYRYDAGGGRYLRRMSGGPHVDGNTGAQLGLENVIVQFVPHQATDIVEDSLGSTSIRLNLFGNGRAIVFRDGVAFDGTWRSESRGDTPRFYDSAGAEVPLKPGRSWISVVPAGYGVTFQ